MALAQSNLYMDMTPSYHHHQHAVYPPVVKDLQVIGYIQDVNGIGYSRDIGRSFTLGGKQFYIFGDTFCKNRNGDFVGISNNTAALIPCEENFCETRYLAFNDDDTVRNFVKLTAEENTLQKNGCGRVTLWGFGGVVELVDGSGCLWFQKGIDHGDGNNKYCGIGLAKVQYNHQCRQLTTERLDDQLANGLLFGPDEPKVGSFSTLIKGPHVYLWGKYKDNIILARAFAYMPSSRKLYKFWNGADYVDDFDDAAPISGFQDLSQGAIIRSDLFGKNKRYIFVGVSKWQDSKIRVGAAETVEGPWEVTAVCYTQGINKTDGFRYCIYPHLFASHMRNAELLVTWSEQWPGGVVAGRVRFQTNEDQCEDDCLLSV